ncbi:Nucleolar protein 9, partial [Spiromyces aspiralis]
QVVRIQAKEKKLETPNGLLDKLLRGLLSTDPTRTMPDQRRDAANEATIKDPVGSHFMQLVLQVVSAELYGKLYGLYFNGRLHELAFHPNANFVVQSLISNVRTSEQLRGIIDELGTKFQDLIFKGRIGVVRSTMDACCKLNCCHEEAVG